MIEAHETLIRQRAYEIWESEGRPEGRQHLHWEQAMRELEPEVNAAGVAEPPRKVSRKKAEPKETITSAKPAAKPRRTRAPIA